MISQKKNALAPNEVNIETFGAAMESEQIEVVLGQIARCLYNLQPDVICRCLYNLI